ncbi:MAG: ion transporter [Bacteroidaceae bacterium]|nr:ion transporter [Bacteroidaceae bacterium]
MKHIFDLLCNERFIMWAIVLNTVCMFLGGFWPECKWFEVSDALFTLLFLAEAVCKISRWSWRSYWSRGWNRFDFIVLVIALPSLVNFFMVPSMMTNSVLAIRSIRLFKAFRMVRFIPNIGKLLNGLKLAFRASLFVLVAFVVVLIVFSILSYTIFGRIAPEYFGNPGISLYSIFRLFSIEGWYEIPDAIAASSSQAWGIFARCYFSALMFLGGIIGMSLINSIFVDSMAEDNNEEVLERLKQIEEMLKEGK